MENTKQTQYQAAAYVRLSKEDLNSVSGLKAESNSISNQKQLILDYLKDKTDIKLVSIREDDGLTTESILSREAVRTILTSWSKT